MATAPELPWRGPAAGRPELPLPPAKMPLIGWGSLRKRWRYVGLYSADLMLCAARAQVGPLGQCFWALWDRREGRSLEHTSLRPGSAEVRLDGRRIEIESREVRARLRLGEAEPVEAICPSGRGWSWTRKRAGIPVEGEVDLPWGRIAVAGLGVDDESAGYHARRTSWRWSAGVGRAADGRALAWNLVEGVNDPEVGSERAVWIDGAPHEPAPVAFEGLAAVRFADGGRLDFRAGAERARDERYLVVRSKYRHRFGEFSGRLDGIELDEGLGVMEVHEAVW